MSKSITAVVVIIIIIVIIGVVSGFYILGNLSQTKKEPPKIIDEDNTPPTAYFTGNDSGRVNEKLWFDGNGSKDKDGVITHYKWDFGDGQVLDLSGTNASMTNHSYIEAKEYEINLTVYDDGGDKDWYIREITILPNDYIISKTDVLISRVGIDEVNESIPVEQFAISLNISISLVWIPSLDGDAIVGFTISDPFGNIIGDANETIRGMVDVYFGFDASEISTVGDYEMEVKCSQGSLYLDYEVEVIYY